MIENRPKYLEDIPFYKEVPARHNIDIDFKTLPPLFNLDLHQLNGLLPLTKSRFDFLGKNGVVDGQESSVVTVNPTDKEIEYFKTNNINEFQLINVVFSLFNFKKENDVLTGMPYAVSLVPGSKRDAVDPWHIDLIKQMDIGKTLGGGWIYTEFNPFSGWYGGFFGQYSVLTGSSGIKNYSDSVGFIWEQYLLAEKFDGKEVLLLEDSTAPKTINSKFRKYRTKLYFDKFENIKPRKIWGCESPIELFLLQGLAKYNKLPNIQTLIFRDGTIFPNYHLMIEDHEWKTQDKLLTNVDFYFPDKKVAIFCDGSAFHDTEEGRKKDEKIDNELKSLGVKPLRFNGKQITETLETVLNKIIAEL
jgi:Protein of unknown function (DUF559)